MAATEFTLSVDIKPQSVPVQLARRSTAEAWRKIGWSSPFWVGRRKCTRNQASIWLRYQLPHAWREYECATLWYPTTSDLRRIMKIAPRSVRCHIYDMLQYRRSRP